MRLETLLNITTAAMTALGAILLGMARQDLFLPILVVMSAGISVLVTDWMKWIVLSKPLANGLALAAVAYSAFEFAGSDVEFQLLAIANLLIYLQVILLFQKKNDRIYWPIIVLSALQVVVSAAISLHVTFGFMLTLYLVLILTELVLFYLVRERKPFLAFSVPNTSEHTTSRKRPAYFAVGWRTPSTASKGLWGATTKVAYFSPLPTSPLEPTKVAPIGWLVLRFTAATLAIATVVFFSVPRVGESWSGRRAGGQRLVGFSNEVSLDDLGRVLDNPTPVMRVSFQDVVTGEPPSLSGEPYFRGSVLDRYQPISGKWSQRRRTLGRRVSGLIAPPSREGLLRQEVQIEPSQQSNVFSVFPIYDSPETPNGVGVDPRTLQLFRTTEDAPGHWEPFQMVGLTNALRFGRMRSLMPCETSGRWANRRLLGNELSFLKDLDEEQLGAIQQLANEILDQENIDRDDPIRVAHRLSAYLEDATQFEYSLDQEQPPPEGVDPIVHFLTTTRSGHCEYFASALVLLLRSQDISARLVIGFKGGDYNTMGNFYQVRQLHAHAWVEAYIPPEFIQDTYLVAGENADAGGWLRLDPTPVDDDASASAANQQYFAAISQAHDYLQMLWDKYVVGLNTERQHSSIYAPVVERLASWWEGSRARVAATWDALVQWMHRGAWERFRRRWLTWQRLLSYLVLGLVLGSMIFHWRRQLNRLAQHLLRRWTERPVWMLGWFHGATGSPQIGFYRKLERQLARYGLRRVAGQTHREFATEADETLRSLPGGESVAQIPPQLVDAFYRVRFGRQSLAAADLAQIDESLKTLAAFDRHGD